MTAVADAIRSKTGGAEPLSFPSGFSEAIEGITTGGGGGSGESAYELLGRALVESFPIVSGGEYTLKISDFVEALPPYYANPLRRVLWQYMFQARTITSIDWTGVSELSIEANVFNNVVFKGFNPSVPAGFALTGYTFFYAKELGGYPLDASYTVVPGSLCESATFTEDVVIPEGVTTLESGAFRGVLRSTDVELTVTLPSTITILNGYGVVTAPYGKTLKLVVNASVPPTLTSTGGISNISSITVPAGTLSAYQEATNWSQFADIMVEASA